MPIQLFPHLSFLEQNGKPTKDKEIQYIGTMMMSLYADITENKTFLWEENKSWSGLRKIMSQNCTKAVSYTHLTLPTKLEV